MRIYQGGITPSPYHPVYPKKQIAMTTYQKELFERIRHKYGRLPPDQTVHKLFELGVVDHTLCKVLAVREYVSEKTAAGAKKIDAMWQAAEHFCCTYEYVRKCVYYYTDVNMV